MRALARWDEAVARVSSLGAEVVRGSLEDETSLVRGARGAGVPRFVHVGTEAALLHGQLLGARR
jgi:uncharacterized protein YbjT (DUF2867 family)